VDGAALVATVVCRRGVAADLRAGSMRGCGWWDRGDRPAALVSSRDVLVVVTSSFSTWLAVPLPGLPAAGCVAG
jgi:hypothetical protein